MDSSYVSNSAEETFELGKSIAASLKSGDIIALHGDLGAGKTVFAKGIASGLGISGNVTSPTFALLKEYNGRLKLHHFDLYRIEDEEELAHIGFYDYLGSDGVCVIEWPGNADHLPPCISVSLTGSGTDLRTITIKEDTK